LLRLTCPTYNTTHNIHVELSLTLHTGEDKNNNDSVWIRGNDLSTWIPVYDLWGNRAAAGTYKNVTSIDISQTLLNAGQNYSSSFQIRFGQEGQLNPTNQLMTVTVLYLMILLLEDITNDIQLLSASSPVSGCGLSSAS
jgi:hypothetical protein